MAEEAIANHRDRIAITYYHLFQAKINLPPGKDGSNPPSNRTPAVTKNFQCRCAAEDIAKVLEWEGIRCNPPKDLKLD